MESLQLAEMPGDDRLHVQVHSLQQELQALTLREQQSSRASLERTTVSDQNLQSVQKEFHDLNESHKILQQ